MPERSRTRPTTGAAYRFPAGFLWGAATAAHQVEGDNSNSDWYRWDQVPGNVKDGSVSGAACEHYKRFREDFDLLVGMKHNAHRLSIEWSRVEPSPGVINGEAVQHYRDVLEALSARGMTPLVTLHHFSNPIWLADMNGWENGAAIAPFANFARLCANEYGDLVRIWSTFNEPNVYAYQSFIQGIWPPQRKNYLLGAKVLRNMLRAHAAAFAAIKASAHGSASEVGVAQHVRLFEPWHKWSPLDRLASTLPDIGFNQWFLEGTVSGSAGFPLGIMQKVPEAAGTMDYIGLNYYTRDMVSFRATAPGNLFSHLFARPGAETSDFQDEVYPQGLHTVLKALWGRYRKPIYVTENGTADATDRIRRGALVAHIAEMARAHREGVDVLGYLHWTSMDNFEWAEGYALRFGLMEVDRKTQARKPRPSAALYTQLIEQNGLRFEDLEAHYPRALPYFVGRAVREESAPGA